MSGAEKNKTENHLFIVWHNAKDSFDNILIDIKSKFSILGVYEVAWDFVDLGLQNLIVFYSQSQYHLSSQGITDLMFHKKKDIGEGSFYLIIVNDSTPVYLQRKTSSGEKIVNANVFDAKELYRQWTGGGYLIHATNSQDEFKRDLALLLGINFNLEDVWLGDIKKIDRNVTGVGGWNSIEEFFYILNLSVNYIVLRNFEPLPNNYYFNEHGDIDLLIENPNYVKYLTGAESVFSEAYRVHHKIKINNDDVYFDFRYLGDCYYDQRWEKDLLDKKVFKNGVFIPDAINHFYSLLYHVLVHKDTVKSDYKDKLVNLSKDINVRLSIDDFDSDTVGYILTNFMNKNDYLYVKPNDLSVTYNEKYLVSVKEFSLEENKIDFSIPFPFIKPKESLISSRFLTRIGGIEYWSCVYDSEELIYKQATMELAKREFHFLKLFMSDYFPKAIDFWSEGEYSVVVLEKIIGLPLNKTSHAFRENFDKMYKFVNECLSILEELKDKNIIHRDIRQANILIRDEHPVLIDFGWAISDEQKIFTPDLLGGQGRPIDGNHSDIYSMGKVIEQVNQGTYPAVKHFTNLMTASDPYLRMNDISILKSIWFSLQNYLKI